MVVKKAVILTLIYYKKIYTVHVIIQQNWVHFFPLPCDLGLNWVVLKGMDDYKHSTHMLDKIET